MELKTEEIDLKKLVSELNFFAKAPLRGLLTPKGREYLDALLSFAQKFKDAPIDERCPLILSATDILSYLDTKRRSGFLAEDMTLDRLAALPDSERSDEEIQPIREFRDAMRNLAVNRKEVSASLLYEKTLNVLISLGAEEYYLDRLKNGDLRVIYPLNQICDSCSEKIVGPLAKVALYTDPETKNYFKRYLDEAKKFVAEFNERLVELDKKTKYGHPLETQASLFGLPGLQIQMKPGEDKKDKTIIHAVSFFPKEYIFAMREAAVQTLAKVGNEEAEKVIAKTLDSSGKSSEEKRLAFASIVALGRVGSGSSVASLKNARGKYPEYFNNITMAIGMTNSKEGEEALLDLLRPTYRTLATTNDVEARKQAEKEFPVLLEALQESGTAESMKFLQSLLNAPPYGAGFRDHLESTEELIQKRILKSKLDLAEPSFTIKKALPGTKSGK
ncbi:MAG: hypothetical protein V1492_06255 [Candidatus Micrarchaeota archaeon]